MSIEFSSKDHEKAYERIKKMIQELFGEVGAKISEDSPHWLIPAGSAMVHVSISAWRDDMHLVEITAYVTQGTEVTPQCMRYLLDENHTMVFGGFTLDSDGDIAFNHSAVAETCQKEDLKTMIMAVSHSADAYDDVIVERSGGKRAYD